MLTGFTGGAGWVALSILAVQLVAIAWIDARRMIIPDALNALLFATGAAASLVTQTPSPAMALAGALAAPAVLAGVRWVVSRRTGREAMGLGDVKFAAGAGAWVGLDSLPLLLVVASVAGLAAALAGRRDGEGRLPFGPFLALGTGVAKVAALLGWPP